MKTIKYEDLTLDKFRNEVARLNALGAIIKESYFKEFNTIIFKYMYYTHEDGIWDDPYMQECRGISFDATSGALVSRPLPKFFNINEVETTKLDVLKELDNQVVQIFDKHDGSLIITELHDDKVVCRTQKTYFNTQSDQANNLFIRLDLKMIHFIRDLLMNHCTPLFELVGPANRVVISYEKNELLYIGYRDNKTGLMYYDSVEGTMADKIDYEATFRRMERNTNYEGVVIYYVDSNLLCKYKIKDYLKKHKVRNIIEEGSLLKAFKNDEIDDILPFILELYGEKEFNNILLMINNWSDEISNFNNEIQELFKIWKDLPRKEYALNVVNTKYSKLLFLLYDDKDDRYYDLLKSLL